MTLFEALLSDDPEVVAPLLLDDFQTLISPIFPRTNALNFCAYHGLSNIIPLLLSSKFPYTNLSPLHYACLQDNYIIIQQLQQYQSTVQNVISPLHICAIYDSIHCARLLLDFCGQKTRKQLFGVPEQSTALEIACQFSSKRVFQLLLLLEINDSNQETVFEVLDLENGFGAENQIQIDFLNLQIAADFLGQRHEIQQFDVEQTPKMETQQLEVLDQNAFFEDVDVEKLKQENEQLKKLLKMKHKISKGKMHGKK